MADKPTTPNPAEGARPRKRQAPTIDLTATEFRLLRYLMLNPRRVLTKGQLLDHVWGDHVFVEERTVDVYVRRLRKALEESGHDGLIQTVRGIGYQFAADH